MIEKAWKLVKIRKCAFPARVFHALCECVLLAFDRPYFIVEC